MARMCGPALLYGPCVEVAWLPCSQLLLDKMARGVGRRFSFSGVWDKTGPNLQVSLAELGVK